VAKTVIKVKRETLGLQGFSPVALVEDSAWVKGLSQHEETYQGLTFYFADADEQATFKSNPEKFLPKYLGCDPVSLKTSERPVMGSIQHGAVYNGRIYFMSSANHQKQFLASPQEYAELLYEVSLEATPEVVQVMAEADSMSTN
ncbi:MAG: hypothetical protein KDA84_18585, partial [Planctomycetaceae bacterium]|nr:hypothetical protein [Planctomycetaceae bacterium]